MTADTTAGMPVSRDRVDRYPMIRDVKPMAKKVRKSSSFVFFFFKGKGSVKGSKASAVRHNQVRKTLFRRALPKQDSMW